MTRFSFSGKLSFTHQEKRFCLLALGFYLPVVWFLLGISLHFPQRFYLNHKLQNFKLREEYILWLSAAPIPSRHCDGCSQALDDGDGGEEGGEAGGEGARGGAAADDHGGGLQDGQQSERTNVAAGKNKWGNFLVVQSSCITSASLTKNNLSNSHQALIVCGFICKVCAGGSSSSGPVGGINSCPFVTFLQNHYCHQFATFYQPQTIFGRASFYSVQNKEEQGHCQSMTQKLWATTDNGPTKIN